MRTYGSLGGITALAPGDALTLLDGTEVAALGLTSMPFARETGPGVDTPPTFQIAFGAAPNATVVIQGSNVDQETAYQTIWSSINTQNDNYTDLAKWAYYRVKITAYVAGGTPVVTVQR